MISWANDKSVISFSPKGQSILISTRTTETLSLDPPHTDFFFFTFSFFSPINVLSNHEQRGRSQCEVKSEAKSKAERKGSGWTQAFSDTRGLSGGKDKILSLGVGTQCGERNPQLRTGVITNNHSLPRRIEHSRNSFAGPTLASTPGRLMLCTSPPAPPKESGHRCRRSCKATSFTAEIKA